LCEELDFLKLIHIYIVREKFAPARDPTQWAMVWSTAVPPRSPSLPHHRQRCALLPCRFTRPHIYMMSSLPRGKGNTLGILNGRIACPLCLDLPHATGRRFTRHFPTRKVSVRSERDLFLDNLVVRIPFIIVMIRWAGLAPWEFELSFPGSRTSTFLAPYITYRCRVNLAHGTQSRPYSGLACSM